MKFKRFLQEEAEKTSENNLDEAKEYQKGIFNYVGEDQHAKRFISTTLEKLVDRNDLITMEDVYVGSYDDAYNETEVVFLAHWPVDEKTWKKFGAYIEKNTKVGYIYYKGVK